ncbi:topoisomerase DNA-binding C4 zinc finger domain-containing protein [Aliifodinibius sp. 1BSP15-2V2]|uniref:Topoisomerase DNA-binding C4 zinc finger domain-containing protein n=1 Tax=Fodinibius salsisoli TaxID=2820877 RepID=A0ABT3PIN3_9BACT|nr:topoisomerase DNA-binding C4 zinc finger domain-containing protein [Fodinibius salsisoli]
MSPRLIDLDILSVVVCYRQYSTTVCPKCSSKLVERIVKKGPNAGTKFLGCKNFPKCRFTRNA